MLMINFLQIEKVVFSDIFCWTPEIGLVLAKELGIYCEVFH